MKIRGQVIEKTSCSCIISPPQPALVHIVQHVRSFKLQASNTISFILQCCILSDVPVYQDPMATESIDTTKSLSAHTPGSSIFPDGRSDGSVTGGRSVDGKESTELQSRGESCTR